MGLCQGRKTALRTLVVTFYTAHYFGRNTVCLKDLTFLFIMQHQLWNDAYFISISTQTQNTKLWNVGKYNQSKDEKADKQH